MSVSDSLRHLFGNAVHVALDALDAINDNLVAPPLTDQQRLERALNPPHDDTTEILHGRSVKDPFRPMENLDSAETAAWAARENKRFDDYMKDTKGTQKAVLDFFKRSKPHGMYESMPEKYGARYFVWRMVNGDVRPCFYVKNVAAYGAPATLLLDPLKIDPSGKTKIVDAHVSPDGKTIAYRLSTSGSDKETLRFFDVDTQSDVGPVYTNFRSAVLWDGDSQGFHYMQSDAATKSRSVRYHKMGTPASDDKDVYTPTEAETSASYFRVRAENGQKSLYEWLHVHNGLTPDKNALLVRPSGSAQEFRKIYPLKDFSVSPMAEVNGRIYAFSDKGAPNGTLISFDVNDPAPEKWQTILPEDKSDFLEKVFVWQGKLFATYRHDTGEQLKVFDLKGQYLYDVPVPPLSTFTLGETRTDDPTCLISFNNYQENGNIYKYDSATNQLTLHKKSRTSIDLKDCIVERIYATSKDGTKVPMTVIRDPKTKLDGTAATLLYGYGGFNVAQSPGFNESIAEWVRAGGIYVVANLRGGGEFGKAWYDDGRQKNKQHVFDDFAACAEQLIQSGYTTSARLAIEGGSNGGLLTLATMLQRPELFGAVVSSVPVTDMFRFHIGSFYGYSWKSDYGDPSIRDDFNTAAKYSPLHNVKKNVKHPPLLIKTDAHDDRVLPWHSYKMAATLQTKEDPSSLTLLKIRTDGGHAAGLTHSQWCEDIALVRAFLVKALGPIDQAEYKAWLAQKTAAKQAPGPKRKFG